jgi:signal transduction histidine kinase
MAAERGHVLVVDDNRTNRLKLSLGLEQQGHTVGLAEDGQQALDILKGEAFDVVLLDIVMPGMDGYQVLERVKADLALRDIPVIVISAVDEMDSVVKCIEMGAEDYLPKPFDPVLLRARLNSCLQKKRLRDLEKSYLQQEVMLRQSEKLATLGRLAAGMAHELNNPAAAAKRASSQLQSIFSHLQETFLKLGGLDLTGSQVETLVALHGLAQERAKAPIAIDPITRADLEHDLEVWLEEQGVPESWDVAPAIVSLGHGRDDLSALASEFGGAQLHSVIDWLHSSYVIYSLLVENGQGAARISQIVDALKAYTYMDQAEIQTVDIHDGLENTLVVLASKLGPDIAVHREYAEDLPRIQAHGSELNQVWTNLIDNAIDALDGRGKITLRTRRDGEWMVAEIEDDGPGIPEKIQSRLFEPFFTTKPPGKGVGLGLNVCHNIVVQKHRGRIDVHSRPGETRFEVRLPISE